MASNIPLSYYIVINGELSILGLSVISCCYYYLQLVWVYTDTTLILMMLDKP